MARDAPKHNLIGPDELHLYRKDPLRETNQGQRNFVVCRECGEKHRSLPLHIRLRHFLQIAPSKRIETYLQKWNYPELTSAVTREKNRQRKTEWLAQPGNVLFGGKRHVLQPGEGPAAVRRNPPTRAMLRARIARSQKTVNKPRHYKRGKKLVGKDRKNATWVQAAPVDDATLVEYRLAGMTTKDIAGKVGLTIGAVIARLKQLDLYSGHSGGRLFLHGQMLTKQSFLDVCDDFGLSKKAVVIAGMKQSYYGSAMAQLNPLRPTDSLPNTIAQCVLNARKNLTERFCFARVAGKKTRRLLNSEIRALPGLREILRNPLIELREWLQTRADNFRPHDILNWLCIQSREEVAGRRSGRGFRTLTILWPVLKQVNAEKHTMLSSMQSVDWKIDELLSRDFGAAARQLRKAYSGKVAALDPVTLGQWIVAELGRSGDRSAAGGAADKPADKRKRGRHREDPQNRTFFRVGTAVEKEIPSELKQDRHSIVAARRLISRRTHLQFDVVAQYHKQYRKMLLKPV
jgi:hypothetical protein